MILRCDIKVHEESAWRHTRGKGKERRKLRRKLRRKKENMNNTAQHSTAQHSTAQNRTEQELAYHPTPFHVLFFEAGCSPWRASAYDVSNLSGLGLGLGFRVRVRVSGLWIRTKCFYITIIFVIRFPLFMSSFFYLFEIEKSGRTNLISKRIIM